MQSADLAPVFVALAAAVGETNVLTGEAALRPYGAAVSGERRRIAGVVRPGSTEDVVAVVKAARQFGQPLYPISRGCNWGLGSRLPARDGACIVDLSRMNRIREVHAGGHYAVVEPGVTQQQLFNHLREHELPLILNVIGSGLDTSLIGNALERGIGYFASRAGSLSGLEVVLGSGTLLRTGFGHYPHAQTTHVYKHGVGPGLDGLFYQSNFGIVTAAGIELLPWRDRHRTVVAKIDDGRKLPALVDAFADLRRREIVRMVVHIGNRHRTIGTLAPLVYEQLGADRTREAAEALLASEGFGPWSAVASLNGTPAQLRLATAEIRRALAGLATMTVLDDERMARASRLLETFRFLPAARRKRIVLRALAPIYGLANGVPTDAALKSVYWAAGDLAPDRGPLQPDEGRAGMLYVLPMLPLEGATAAACVAWIEETMTRRALTPIMTLNLLDDRCLEIVLTVAFRRDDADQAARARACVDELLAGLVARGFPPYRVGVDSMASVVSASDPFWQVAREVKKALDPDGIIAPGRYSLD